jgi:hypothetical protein
MIIGVAGLSGLENSTTGAAVTTTASSSAATTTAAAAGGASTSTTSTSAGAACSSGAASGTTSSSNATAIGAGVGASLGACLVAALCWGLYERRQRGKLAAALAGNDSQTVNGGELDASPYGDKAGAMYAATPSPVGGGAPTSQSTTPVNGGYGSQGASSPQANYTQPSGVMSAVTPATAGAFSTTGGFHPGSVRGQVPESAVLPSAPVHPQQVQSHFELATHTDRAEMPADTAWGAVEQQKNDQWR